MMICCSEQCADLWQKDIYGSIKAHANATPAKKRILLRWPVQSRNGFICANIKRAYNQRLVQESSNFVVKFVLGIFRRETLERDKFGAKQPNAFGSRFNCFVGLSK